MKKSLNREQDESIPLKRSWDQGSGRNGIEDYVEEYGNPVRQEKGE